MKLGEAIKHARQKAKEMRILSTANHGGVESCIKCAEEHEQLAVWLEELEERRKGRINCTNCKYADVHKDAEPCCSCIGHNGWRLAYCTDEDEVVDIWRKVRECLPDEGEEVIVTDGKYYGITELISGITAEGVCYWFDSWEHAVAWMPIPKYEGGKEDE